MAETKKVEQTAQNTEKSEASADVVSEKEDTNGKNLMEKIRSLGDKGLASLKKGGEKIAHFADSSTKLAKIKLDVHNLETECGKLNLKAGEKLWNAHKENKLDDVAMLFDEEFKAMANLKKQIAALQKQADKISLVD